MSDSSEGVTPPSENISGPYLSPLHTVLTEIHEIYQELLRVGFIERVAAVIVANLVQDAMMYRVFDDDSDDEDESDEENERGFE